VDYQLLDFVEEGIVSLLLSTILKYSNIVEYPGVRDMSANKGRPSEQIFPWSYPQVYNPPPVYYFRPAPKKRNDLPIVIVVVAFVACVIVMPMVLSSIMFSNHYEPNDYEYYNDEPFVFFDNETVPMAFVSSVNVTSPTDATMLLGNFSRDPAATEFRLVLEREGTVQGTYDFPSDTDCELVFAYGTDIADLFYVDLNDNLELDPGDEISIVNLTPDSFYEVTIIYIPTGYDSTYSSFWTPPR
jgi:hypothetical protein